MADRSLWPPSQTTFDVAYFLLNETPRASSTRTAVTGTSEGLARVVAEELRPSR